MSENDRDVVVQRELELLDPAIRACPVLVEALLHPDFEEYGASGRVWDRAAIVAELSERPGVSRTPRDFEPRVLSEGVVLLTYRLGDDPGSLRSSLWVHEPEEGWRLLFHQGTQAPTT